MAISTTRPVSGNGIFGGLVADFESRLTRRRLYRQTLKELSALSDRELWDLGVARSSIHDVAMSAAYGHGR